MKINYEAFKIYSKKKKKGNNLKHINFLDTKTKTLIRGNIRGRYFVDREQEETLYDV